MSLRDVSRLTHLGWDTVKDIVKADLQVRYAEVPLKKVKRIAIDELYLGSKAKYVTLVIDLDSGRVLWHTRRRRVWLRDPSARRGGWSRHRREAAMRW